MDVLKYSNKSGLQRALFFSLFALLLCSSFSGAFRITQVTASPNLIKATTGTSVNVAVTLKGDSTGTATQTVLTGSGQTTATNLRVVDPSSGYFSGTQVSTLSTPLTFLVTASLADSYNFKVTSTYTGGLVSSPITTIQFVDPGTLTVKGSVTSTNIQVGGRDAFSVTLTNPGASNVTSSFAFSANPTAFSVVSGDPTSGIITLTPGGSYTFSWSLNAKAAVSNSALNFSLGSNPQAFSKSVTVTAIPILPIAFGGSSATVVPPVATSTASPSSSSSSGPSGPSSPSEAVVAASSTEVTHSLSPVSSVSGSFTDTGATLTLTAQAGPSGATSVTEEFGGSDLHCSDITDGTVTIDPAISRCQDGSIIATWDVNLAPQQTFTATINVAKKLDQAVLSTFKPPKVVSSPSGTSGTSPGSMPAAPSSKAPSAPVSASAPMDYTLWYALGAIVILGLLYYAFVSNKSKHKGL